MSQYLLINIRIQALQRERMEAGLSLEGIQFRSGSVLDEDAYDRSISGVRSMTATAEVSV